MDADLMKPFMTAATGVFSTMFNLQAVAGPWREAGNDGEHGWDVSGILGFTGGAQGVLALRLPSGLAYELLRLSGVESADAGERDATMYGLVGEISNIIAGNAIGELADLDLDISPPVVVKGRNHSMSWPKIGPVLAATCRTDAGSFELAVCMSRC